MAKPTEKVEVTTEEMDLITEGLDQVKADYEKVLASEERMKLNDAAAATRKRIGRIEDLKTKFLHS